MSTPGTPAERTARRRRRQLLWVALIVALAVVAVVAITHRSSHEAQAGDRVDALSVTEDAQYLEAPLAGARVKIRVDSDVEADDGDYPYRKAPEGLRFVEVEWTVEQSAVDGPVIWPGAEAAQRAEVASAIVVVSGSHRYVVAPRVYPSSGPGRAVVLVPDGGGIEVHATSGGRDDVARDRDRSYRPGGSDEPEQGTSTAFVPGFEASRAPYVAGLGWAPSGNDWVVVTDVRAVTSRLDRATIAGAGETTVSAIAKGPGRLALSVNGAGAPRRTVGSASTTAQAVTAPSAAYLVASGTDATVRLTFTQQLVADPADDTAGAVSSPVVGADTETRVLGPLG